VSERRSAPERKVLGGLIVRGRLGILLENTPIQMISSLRATVTLAVTWTCFTSSKAETDMYTERDLLQVPHFFVGTLQPL